MNNQPETDPEVINAARSLAYLSFDHPGTSSSSPSVAIATAPQPAAAAPPKIPRSAASIAFALDRLEETYYDDDDDDDGDEEERHATEGGHPSSPPHPLPSHSTQHLLPPLPPRPLPRPPPNPKEDAAEKEAQEEDQDLRRQAIATSLSSHPLQFTSQFPCIAIVTTASLPWLTGTAVNPALRAAYLWRVGHSVTLLAPWVPPHDQPRLFPEGVVFETPQEQAVAVIEAIQKRVPFPLPPATAHLHSHSHSPGEGNSSGSGTFRLVFYKGRYDPGLGSIMPEEDIQPLIPLPVDCIILEEPEHLTWYHTGRRWTRAFSQLVPVIGVMHTNYVDYARREVGEAGAGALRRLNAFLCRQHTHKVVKLSDAVQELPRQETCFVHGVSHTFLAVSDHHTQLSTSTSSSTATTGQNNAGRFSKGMYFLGKALWAKGFAELLDRFTELMQLHHPVDRQMVDVYGKGEQLEAIKMEALIRGLPLRFLGAKDHLSPDMAEYRAFLNPSTSDVVATTTAEALAMGKWVIVPRHPCNDFFSSFANCLVYTNTNPLEFAAAVHRAFQEEPALLTAEERRRLTWEAATDRFLFLCAATEVRKGPALARVAAKTGWVGYNVGYQVYAVANGVLDLLRKGNSGGSGSGSSTMTGSRSTDDVQRMVNSHVLNVSAAMP